MVFSIAFKDGRAYFRNKFVKTKGFKEEQVIGQWCSREGEDGMWGMRDGGSDR